MIIDGTYDLTVLCQAGSVPSFDPHHTLQSYYPQLTVRTEFLRGWHPSLKIFQQIHRKPGNGIPHCLSHLSTYLTALPIDLQDCITFSLGDRNRGAGDRAHLVDCSSSTQPWVWSPALHKTGQGSKYLHLRGVGKKVRSSRLSRVHCEFQDSLR